MSATTKILSKLAKVKKQNGGWSARCPAHEDRNASLSIDEGRDGRVLLKCFAGCDLKKIVSALGVEERDLFESIEDRPATAKKAKPPKVEKKTGRVYETAAAAQKAYERTLGKPATSYAYRDSAGEHVGSVIRWQLSPDEKEIRPISLHSDGWRLEHMPEPRPLVRLPELLAAAAGDRVYVVEGEKCVHALSAGLGLDATTSSGGSNAAGKTDWSPLAGLDVVILPDADEPGRKYAAAVAEILLGLDPPAVVRIVDLAPDSDDGSDVADLVEPAKCLGEPLRDLIERRVAETMPLQPKATTTATPAAAPTSSSVEAWRPLPTRSLPPVAAAIVEEGARAIGCDEAFVAMPLLAVLGSAIGTTRRVELKPGWRPLPILWPVTVAESGSQKSPGADVSLDPIRDREDRLHDEYAAAFCAYELDLEEYEKSRAAWRHSKQAGSEPPTRPRPPIHRRVLLDDLTVEALVAALADSPRGVLVANDELSSWFGSMGRYNGAPTSDEAFWLKAYGGRPHNVSRRGGRSLHVRQAAVWLTGTIQPGTLARSLGVERRESGLLARLLLAAPPRRAKKWTTDSIGWTTREDFDRVLGRLYNLEHELVDGRQESKIVRLGRDAEDLYRLFYEEHGRETIELSGDLAAAWSKLEETAGRLALIVHETKAAAAGGRGEDLIDAETMVAALDLVAWFKHETRRVYALLAESEVERQARHDDDRVAAFVERHGGTVAARDLIAGLRAIPDADAAERALRRLVDAGRGRWIDKPTTERGGRPTRFFELKAEPPSAQPQQPAAEPGSACADAPRGAEVEAGEEYVEI